MREEFVIVLWICDIPVSIHRIVLFSDDVIGGAQLNMFHRFRAREEQRVANNRERFAQSGEKIPLYKRVFIESASRYEIREQVAKARKPCATPYGNIPVRKHHSLHSLYDAIGYDGANRQFG